MSRLSVVVMSLFVIGTAVPAAAQGNRADLTLGYQYQKISDGGSDSTSFPAGIDLELSAPIHGNVSIVGQVDWSHKSESAVVIGTSVEASSDATTFGGGLRWGAHGMGVNPFLTGLVGATHGAVSGTISGVNVGTSSDTKGMFQVGGGLALPVTPAFSGVVSLDYRRIFTEEPVNSVRFVAGIRLGF